MTLQTNWLLDALDKKLRAAFAPQLQRIELRAGQTLSCEGDEVEFVYFPWSAVVGLVSTMPTGEAVQTAMVGWDGAMGVFEACGSRRYAYLAEVQLGGSAWRMAAADYRRMFESSEEFRVRIHHYIEILLTEARQFVACNALHDVPSRLSRSLLEALDRRRERGDLPLTQDALAQMLGVQRTTVTSALADLQAAGAIRTGRGRVQIEDKDVLEAAACCCRDVIKLARREILASGAEVCD